MPVINIDRIIIDDGYRKLNKKVVKQLATSIEVTGMINPIALSNFRLVSGRHRIEALKLLGRDLVGYVDLGDLSDEDFEIARIDENLFVNHIPKGQLRKMKKRRDEIIEARIRWAERR